MSTTTKNTTSSFPPMNATIMLISRPAYHPSTEKRLDTKHNGHMIRTVMEPRSARSTSTYTNYYRQKVRCLTCLTSTTPNSFYLYTGSVWETWSDLPTQEAPYEPGNEASEMPNLHPFAVRTKNGWRPQVIDSPRDSSGPTMHSGTIVWEGAESYPEDGDYGKDDTDNKITAAAHATEVAKKTIEKVTAKAFTEWADA